MHVLQQTSWLCVVGLGCWLVISNALTVGGLIASSMLMMRCFSPLQKVHGHLVSSHAAQAGFAELSAFLSGPLETSKTLEPVAELHSVELQNLTIRLGVAKNKSKKPQLADINLRLPKGARLAVIGPTGAGKTTLLAVLAGVHQADEGSHRVNGRPFSHIQPEEFASWVGYAPQPPAIREGTLLSNVQFERNWVSIDACRAALHAVGLTPWLEEHPDGIERPLLAQGTNLSSGQRQLIGLARALAGSPGLLILDEPTVCLDDASQGRIFKLLSNLPEHMMLVFATHQRSLLECATHVAVIDSGRLADFGEVKTILRKWGDA
ncbi:MAG: ATP-binding cassette domain-containing protein [Limnobacter sp.]|nr:ATP-binding cassette domain-containing protein [Limnobacter sp.]